MQRLARVAHRCASSHAQRRLQLFEQALSDVRDYSQAAEFDVDLGTVAGNRTIVKTAPTSLFSLLARNSIKSAPFVACKVDDKWTGLHSQIDQPCRIDCVTAELVDSTPQLREMYDHTGAHVLGAALEALYGDDLLLCDGPAIKPRGCFYEGSFVSGRTLSETDIEAISKEIALILKRSNRIEYAAISRDTALSMFSENPYKKHFISRVAGADSITVYRLGSFVDLCRGPHLPSTKEIRAFAVTKVSGAHFLGQLDKPLQRVYGLAFSSQAQLATWQKAQQLAKERDHRLIGKTQALVMMHEYSPGAPFMLPHGTHIINTLVAYLRGKYAEYGYSEVRTPLVFHTDLWATSGHLDHYKDNMYFVSGSQKDSDVCSHGLKPMNCPAHCLIFGNTAVSYRDLPMRLADFSPLHRNEAHGALTGLTRVRQFHQDDAHIFCTEDQIETEVEAVLKFIEEIYGIFGFELSIALSTRPEEFVGDIETWCATFPHCSTLLLTLIRDRAEKTLKMVLDRTGRKWELNPKDGAFYGPKIDVRVKDALDRHHQTATVQLDFQLPKRFGLTYTGGCVSECSYSMLTLTWQRKMAAQKRR